MSARTILLTGGSRGIGAAIITVLKARGLNVLSPTRNELDLSVADSVETYLNRRRDEPVDILINNAGINLLNDISDIDRGSWQMMLQTNLTSALRLTQAFAPSMQERGWGRILNISTVFSLVTKERRAAYSITKAGLNALTRSSAIEYGPAGVLVNALAPGYVDTALTRQNNTPEAIEAIISTIPLRRLAQANELAQIAAFLVSEENTYLTGQTIVVDGGYTCL